MKKLLLFLFIIIAVNHTKSQIPSDSFLLGNKYGISSYYDLNGFSVDLRQLSSIADSVPRSAMGSNNGFAIGAFYEYRFTDRTSLMLKLLYSNQKAQVNGRTPETLLLNSLDTLGWSHHYLSTNLSNIKIEPILKYRLANKLSIYGGANIGFRFDKTYQHYEIPEGIENATYLDGTSKKTGIDENKIDKFGLQSSILLGFSYDIPLNYNGKYLLIPEAMFSVGFSDISKGLYWEINTFRIGCSFMYSENPTIFKPKEIFFEKKENIHTINIPDIALKKEYLKRGKEIITYDTISHGFEIMITQNITRIDTLFYPIKVDAIKITPPKNNNRLTENDTCIKFNTTSAINDKESNNLNISIEEFFATNMKPLLNYIFFESGSSKLSPRYQKIKATDTYLYSLNELKKLNTLETYYHILNIIAYRMLNTPNAKITLIGCISNDSIEKDLSLALQRALSIKQYLVDIWNINPDRIMVKSRDLPEFPSNPNTFEGAEENRRVEIYSDDINILAPLIISDTLKIVSPEQIRFYNNFNKCFEIDKWTLNILQENDTLMRFKGSGNIPERLIWRIAEQKRTLPKTKKDITPNLEIIDIIGTKKLYHLDTINVKITSIEEKIYNKNGDKRIDEYSLIIFDFDKSSLNENNQRILNYINTKINSNSKVYIQGYTDRIGEENYNLELSLKRAKMVANLIKNTNDIEIKAFGEKQLLFDNEFPEGRFYCRTVKIIVETPITN